MAKYPEPRRSLPLLIALVTALAMISSLAGCWRSSPQAAQQALAIRQCNAGKINCVKPADSKFIIRCQAGDMTACQSLATEKCNSGDRHVCQSLAVIYSQLKPLCASGNPQACADMKAPWPDPGFWRADDQIAQAQGACKTGDTQSCQALGTSVHANGSRLLWVQSYVAPAAQTPAISPNN